MLKKEKSYTYPSPLGLRGMLYGEIELYVASCCLNTKTICLFTVSPLHTVYVRLAFYSQ